MDSIANFLTIIRNGVHASKTFVVAPHSKLSLAIGGILRDEGFIKDCIEIEQEPGKKALKVVLKYVDGESVIHEIERASKSSLRYYVGARTIRPVIGGLGISILTTSQGVITNKKAEQLGVGGEVICTVW